MGENDVQMESAEQMQEPHASSSDKIDLSLDDIIKLNKKEQKANRAANRAKTKRASNRNNVLKKLNQVPQQQRGLRRGAQPYQGPGRMRGLRKQRGSGRGMMSRRASLNRAADADADADAATTGEQFDQTTFTTRGTFRGRGRGRGRGGGLSRGALSARGQRGGRPFVLDRAFFATKSAEKLQKYQTIRSRRTAPSGSTLTVSLPNAKSAPVAVKTSNQARRGGAVLRGRSSRGAGTSSPKGIPLQFNYKATTNQTAVYLNDRFTDLRLRGRGRGRGGGRGRGDVGGAGGRGNIVGGGRGRGQGNIGGGRGRGRGNIMGGGRGRGNMGGGRGRGNIMGGGRGRGGVGVTRGGRGLRRGRGADRTVTLQ
ncbi:probable H/ACA ribonucleoprotein complex subunit 1 [Puntigrus tetrazona]|uniref:probable H/ACA ribonucleoprotein complex subunit 1 n=1 Tax=Puntigrus tetrazona TaxID=1606681 RepID=UPI001C896A9E|nr:probable H/ACA ribonucleoprotein complex subunit 1 [Puntigrus tetrazona]